MKYLVYGADSYRSREFIREKFPNGIRMVDNANELSDAVLDLNQPSLFAQNSRVTVFRNLWSDLKVYVDEIVRSQGQWVIWLEQAKQPSLVKEYQPLRGFVEINEFQPLPTNLLRSWIRNKLGQLELRLTPQQVERLVSLHSGNLGLLDNELQKIKLYSLEMTGEITDEELEKLTFKSVDEHVFGFIDVIGSRKANPTKGEVQVLNNLHIDPWYIYSMIVRQIRLIYRYKVTGSIKAHPFVEKKVSQQAKLWSEDELKVQMYKLLTFERQAKQGLVEPRAGLVNWFLQFLLKF